MANALDSLLAQVQDAELARRLKAEIEARSVGTGLVWEHHEPETVDLHSLPVAKGRHVRLLPPRGVNAEKLAKTAKGRKQIDPMWGRVGRVANIDKVCPGATRMARVVFDGAGADGALVEVEWDADDLVCVARFDEPIYPGLTKIGEVRRGGEDDPEHVVINAENYHALQMLAYTHAGSVDAIYIDPPYNTGARDWKYNNDYVDREDANRHSKWLAFMERRLKLAKLLLNPEDSVLIVTIDEKEYLRLGLLLEQTFPEARIQMVSSVINPKGTARANEFSRVDEYIFFVMVGTYRMVRGSSDMMTNRDYGADTDVRWRGMARNGRKGLRPHNPGSWYPIYLNEVDLSFHSVGDTVYPGDPEPVAPPGTVAMWPPESGADQYSWSVVPATFRELHARGGIRLGRPDFKKMSRAVYYVTNNMWDAIESGLIEIVGQSDEGALELRYAESARSTAPKTQWNRTSHEAGAHGTNILRALMPDRRFPFPKSLYAVEDALRFFVKDKPNATILDFFSGSGTTVHAVMRLNKQDDGKRRSISVTNNEVSADEQAALIAKKLRPGDPDWDVLGIADHVTKPRIAAAITGHVCGDPGKPKVKGKYKFTDEFDMADGFEANASFWTLNYLDPAYVEVGLAFERIAPLLWLKAGQTGAMITEVDEEAGYVIADAYAVLFAGDALGDLVKELDSDPAHEDVAHVFVVTDRDTLWEQANAKLRGRVAVHRLYEQYLTNFEILGGK